MTGLMSMWALAEGGDVYRTLVDEKQLGLGNSNSREQIGLASSTGKKFSQFRGSLLGSWANLPPASLSRNRPAHSLSIC